METTTLNVTKLNFNQIYSQNKGEITYFIGRFFKDSNIIEEVVNDTFVKVSQNLSSFDSSRCQFRTWLYNIAKNTAIDTLRKEQKRSTTQNVGAWVNDKGNEVFQFVAPVTTDCEVVNMELTAKINKVVSELKPQYQQIAELYFCEQLRMEEIAKRLNISLANVKVLIFRCREMLQRQLIDCKNIYLTA